MSSFKLSNKSVCMLADFIENLLNSQSNEIGYGISSHTKGELKKSIFGLDTPKNGYYQASTIHKELYMMNCQALIERYGLDEDNGSYEAYECSIISFIPIWVNDGYCRGHYEVKDKHFQLLKTLQCYLYQCMEGDVPETWNLYKTLRTLQDELMRFIINNDVRYLNAEWK